MKKNTRSARKVAKPRPAKASAPQVFEDLTPEEGSTRVDLPAETAVSPRWSRWVEDARWEEYDLLPYQPSVEDLWHRLCLADIPLPMGEVMANLDAFTSCAKKLLYLLSHQPWQYRHLRSDAQGFIDEIERWSDLNVPRSRNVELVTMILGLHNRAHLHDAAAGK